MRPQKILGISAIALVMALMMSGCGPQEDELQDHTGTTQAQIHDGGWAAPNAGAEITPRMGSDLGRAPDGATKDNSYYFDVFRTYQPAEDEGLQDIIRQTADDWADRGWQVTVQTTSLDDRTYITTTTPEQYWFKLAESNLEGQLSFTGTSPVYWVTDYMGLGRATQERREAQNDAADEWPVADQSSETRRLFQPGEHRPFPAWEIID